MPDSAFAPNWRILQTNDPLMVHTHWKLSANVYLFKKKARKLNSEYYKSKEVNIFDCFHSALLGMSLLKRDKALS